MECEMRRKCFHILCEGINQSDYKNMTEMDELTVHLVNVLWMSSSGCVKKCNRSFKDISDKNVIWTMTT